MKNWSTKLIVAMMATVAITLLFTGTCHMSHHPLPSSLPVTISFLLAVGIMMHGIKVATDLRPAALLALIPTAVYFCANQWCFYSTNETVYYEELSDFLEAKEKPLYFYLDHYYWSGDVAGIGEKITKDTSSRDTSSTRKTYVVIPLYPDSIPSEIKVWLADEYDSEDFEAAEDYKELLRLEEIVSFELLTEDLKDYQTVAGYSPDQDKAKDAIFIRPLYKEYITKDTWGLYFLISFIVGTAAMAIIGFILNRRDKREAEEMANAEEE